MERNPDLYFFFEVTYRSKKNMDWIAEVFYDLPEDVDQSIKCVESLLEFLQRQSENLINQVFELRLEALYELKTCGPIQSLARMILETIGKNNKITLTMQNISGQFIAFCNKFIIGSGSENMNVNYLLIQPDDTDLILDSFSQHLIGETMAEVEDVALDGLVLSTEILKSLLHCNDRKILAGKAKLTSLCLFRESWIYPDDYDLFSKMGSFLKNIELTGWTTKNVIQFLNSFTGFKDVLESLLLTKMIKVDEEVENQEQMDDIVSYLENFINSSKIKKVSFAHSMLSRRSLDALVTAAQANMLPIDTLVLCDVEIVDRDLIVDKYHHLQQMAKLIGLLPLVTISGRRDRSRSGGRRDKRRDRSGERRCNRSDSREEHSRRRRHSSDRSDRSRD